MHFCSLSFACNCSLFQWGIGLVQDFWYSNNAWHSPKLLSDVLLLPQVMENLRLWFGRTSSFTFSALCTMKVTDGLDVGVGELKALDVGLGGSWFGQSGQFYHPPQASRGFSSSTTMLSMSALPCLSEGWNHLSSVSDQLSIERQGWLLCGSGQPVKRPAAPGLVKGITRSAQSIDFNMHICCNNMVHGEQYRFQLHQDHKTSHDPRQQL